MWKMAAVLITLLIIIFILFYFLLWNIRKIFEAFKKIYPVLQRYKKKTFEKTNDTTSDQGKGEEH